MHKLMDKMTEREACRARVLELRRVVREADAELYKLGDAREAADAEATREGRRLAALTSELVQLAHADLSGIVGSKPGTAPDAQPSTVAAP